MSQQKVDRYKQEKAHRKERLEKEKKRKKLLRICSYFVLAVIVLAIAFAIYRHYTPKTETPAETETTVESVIETTTAEESTVEEGTIEEGTVEESTAAKTEDTDTESTSEETADIESAAEETDAAGTESTAADGEAAQAENDYHEKTPISGDKWRMIPSSFATGTGVFLFLIIACSQSTHYFLAIKYRSQYSSSLIFSIFTSPPIPSAIACSASSVCSILETYTST